MKPYTHIRIQLTPFKYNKKKQLGIKIFFEIYWVSQLTCLQNENQAHLMTFLTFCLLSSAFSALHLLGSTWAQILIHLVFKKKTIILNQRFWQHRSNNKMLVNEKIAPQGNFYFSRENDQYALQGYN